MADRFGKFDSGAVSSAQRAEAFEELLSTVWLCERRWQQEERFDAVVRYSTARKGEA